MDLSIIPELLWHLLDQPDWHTDTQSNWFIKMHALHKLSMQDKLHMQDIILNTAFSMERLVSSYTKVPLTQWVIIKSIFEYVEDVWTGKLDFSTLNGDDHRMPNKMLGDVVLKAMQVLNEIVEETVIIPTILHNPIETIQFLSRDMELDESIQRKVDAWLYPPNITQTNEFEAKKDTQSVQIEMEKEEILLISGKQSNPKPVEMELVVNPNKIAIYFIASINAPDPKEVDGKD